MKYYMASIAIFFCVFNVTAQSSDSIVQYYVFSNKAELAIVDKQYQSALQHYQRAFHYKKPDPLDLYNAFIVAYMQRDIKTARSCFNQMVLHGMEKSIFETRHYGEKIKKEQRYKQVTAQYDSVHALALRSPMVAYALVMDSIRNADQEPRTSMNANDNERTRTATLTRDHENIAFLKGYIAQHGWPGFEQTGLFEKTSNGLIYTSNTIWFTLWHTRHISKELNEVALQAARKANLSPEQYALIMDMQDKESVYYNVLPRTMDNYGKTTFLPVPDEPAVNRKRAELYLEPIADYKRKLLYTNERKHPFRLVSDEAFLFNFAPVNLRTWEKM